MLRTRTFYLMWVGYALGCSAGLMVISQLVPFAKSVGVAAVDTFHHDARGRRIRKRLRPNTLGVDVRPAGAH